MAGEIPGRNGIRFIVGKSGACWNPRNLFQTVRRDGLEGSGSAVTSLGLVPAREARWPAMTLSGLRNYFPTL
jgi:hypothetical protein